MLNVECKGTIKRGKNQIYLSFSEREYLRAKPKGTIKRGKNQILEQRMQRKARFSSAESRQNKPKANLFEFFRTDERRKRRAELAPAMPFKEEENRRLTEYLRPKVRGTIRRGSESAK